MYRSRIGIIHTVECRNTAERIQNGYTLSKVRHRNTYTNLGPNGRRVNVHRIFSRLSEVLFPLQIARDTDIPNRERNARPHLELTRNRMAEAALIHKRIYVMVPILCKAHVVITMV